MSTYKQSKKLKNNKQKNSAKLKTKKKSFFNLFAKKLTKFVN